MKDLFISLITLYKSSTATFCINVLVLTSRHDFTDTSVGTERTTNASLNSPVARGNCQKDHISWAIDHDNNCESEDLPQIIIMYHGSIGF